MWYSAVQRFIEIRQKNPQAPPPEKLITGHSLLEITAREGAHGLDIEDVTQVAGEEEILFPPGTRVYLHSMQISNCRITVSREDFAKWKKQTIASGGGAYISKQLERDLYQCAGSCLPG